MASDDLTAPAVPAGLLAPAQVRPRHDDLEGAGGHVVFRDVAPSWRVREAADVADPEDDLGRGTPLQAMAGWGAAFVLGASTWAGGLALVVHVFG
ncbi:hypothetical protein [Pseudokineococcus sp. 1T1Z-3]|uniref:hypothetical protein n=1 Tax=Pseudokineococcus sp. 1T1Z-3 TaxID=3132745 RepID=UPI00309F7D69